MTVPLVDDGDVRLFVGDAETVLRELPDESVHCAVTSPPFYALRDYGTGSWEGGDPECDHAVRRDARIESSTLGGGKATTGHQREGHKDACLRCGAVRIDQQIGMEATPEEWCARLVAVFREVRRVLRRDGTLWVECGDSYASGTGSGKQGATGQRSSRTFTAEGIGRPVPPGLKPKDLLGQPWMLAFALRADGWYLRSEIIWARPNPMPESVTDRPTKSHSTVFLLSKSAKYFYDADAIREAYKPDGRRVTTVKGRDNSEQHRDGERWPNPAGANARSVWTIPTEPTSFAHFATWPQALVRRMILAGTSERGCCPVCGAPWVRETETSYDSQGRATNGPRSIERRHETPGFERRLVKSSVTTNWRPTCRCVYTAKIIRRPNGDDVVLAPLDPVPCTVIDPFGGSGTTALVARKLGRKSILIELSEEYARMAAERTQQLSVLAETWA